MTPAPPSTHAASVRLVVTAAACFLTVALVLAGAAIRQVQTRSAATASRQLAHYARTGERPKHLFDPVAEFFFRLNPVTSGTEGDDVEAERRAVFASARPPYNVPLDAEIRRLFAETCPEEADDTCLDVLAQRLERRAERVGSDAGYETAALLLVAAVAAGVGARAAVRARRLRKAPAA